jgi:hypothetical protein
MPIRFRCAYCNQLLGIARRKAGTVVRCPNCAGQVVVPAIDEDEPEAPEPSPVPQEAAPKPVGAAAPPLFERSDFDDILKPVASREPANVARGPVASPPAPPAPQGAREAIVDPAGVNVERVPLQQALIPTLEPMAPQPGIWLSPAKATLLSVLIVLALTLMFVLGLMVGLYFGRTPS